MLGALGLLGGLWRMDVASAQPGVPVVRFSVGAFQVEGDNPLSDALTRRALAPFLGDHEGVDGLLAAADALEQYLVEAGFSFHRVSLPQQTLESGTVRLEIVEFRVGRVDLSGNSHFSRSNVLASLPALREGAPPNTRELSRQLQLANEHPVKHVEVKFRESEAPGRIDAHVSVRDGRPWSAFASFNNAGSEATTDTRFTAGFQHSNLFDRDHVVTATYTTSLEEPSQVKQYGLSYSVPLYALAGRLAARYIESDVDTGQINGIDVSGAGRFVALQYRQLLPRRGAYTQALGASLEDRLFEGDLLFNGVPLPFSVPGNVDVRSRPVGLVYEGSYRHARGATGFHAGYYRNLGGGSKNDKPTYRAATGNRAGTTHIWEAVRFGGHFDYLPGADWLLRGRMGGQWADEPLISGEQYGIGGVNSVRGYEERVLAGDSGVDASLELWTPPLDYGARLLIFGDFGYRSIESQNVAGADSDGLASVGLGLRWAWKRQLGVHLDWARTLTAAGIPGALGSTGAGRSKLHFNLFYRY